MIIVGADNQAERVIAKMEFREHLAQVFHTAWREHVKVAPFWDGLRDEYRAGTIAGITAVLDAIDMRIEEHSEQIDLLT